MDREDFMERKALRGDFSSRNCVCRGKEFGEKKRIRIAA
jgi:hypothetical protein